MRLTKTLVPVFVLLLAWRPCRAGAQQPACPNGNLEQGNFANWSGAYGQYTGTINFNNLTYAFAPNRHTLMTPGPDLVPALAKVNQGGFSLRLGNSSNGANADLAKYTFTVTPANMYFSFRYAMVMEDPGHPANEQPYFGYMVFKGAQWTDWAGFAGGAKIIGGETFRASATNPYFTVAPNGIVWRNWTTHCIDLSSYVGQTVSIIFTAADCSPGLHFGYAYIDALCENNKAVPSFEMPTSVCLSDQIIADGSASSLETDHFWAIQESDAQGALIGPEYTEWFIAKPAATLNLASFIEKHGGKLQCDRYYKVKLAVRSQCTSWAETAKLLHVRCPVVPEIPDQVWCCGFNGFVHFGPDKNPEYLYSWTANPADIPYQVSAGGNKVFVSSPQQSATFTLTVTDHNGCSAKQDVKMQVFPPFTLKLQTDKNNCCGTTFKANVEFSGICESPALSPAEMNKYFSFKWSNGASGSSIYVDEPNSSAHTVSVNGPCSPIQTATGQHAGSVSGSFTPLIAPNAFRLGGPNSVTNNLWFKEFGPNAPFDGQSPAYNATEYELLIYTRWGELVRTVKGGGPGQCLWQGQISWDGKHDNGNYVIPGEIYVYRLFLRNCNTDWKPACNMTNSKDANGLCKRRCWKWWPPGYRCCETWNDQCIYHVTACPAWGACL